MLQKKPPRLLKPQVITRWARSTPLQTALLLKRLHGSSLRPSLGVSTKGGNFYWCFPDFGVPLPSKGGGCCTPCVASPRERGEGRRQEVRTDGRTDCVKKREKEVKQMFQGLHYNPTLLRISERKKMTIEIRVYSK